MKSIKISKSDARDIAVVGYSCRLPGARTPDEFWSNLAAGRECIADLRPEDVHRNLARPRGSSDPRYVYRSPVLKDDVSLFDAEFFDYSPREAELMDPQQRIFLECCWEACEHAGRDPKRMGGTTGVFGGTSASTYLFNIYPDLSFIDQFDPLSVILGNDKDSLTTRISYKLNLQGPSVVVQTYCSTSLVAVHLACQSLRAGECGFALAGGVTVRVPHRVGYLATEGGMLSRDGRCRVFDTAASGTVFGNGAGVVVLRRLSDALRDHDPIHAVIRGTAVNNDGGDKSGFLAPSGAGQQRVLAAALTEARFAPEDVSYIEVHGTGTRVGDPIEFRALREVFGKGGRRCALGSVKANIGHAESAAGIAGLIKTILMLRHRRIPPQLNFDVPNPEIDLNGSLYIARDGAPWNATAPRVAGVSSYGIGGTNAHVIVCEAPSVAEPPTSADEPQLLVMAARSATALVQVRHNLAAHIGNEPKMNLERIAFTLLEGRTPFVFRSAVVADTCAAAVQALASSSTFEEGKAAGLLTILLHASMPALPTGSLGGRFKDFATVRTRIADTLVQRLAPMSARRAVTDALERLAMQIGFFEILARQSIPVAFIQAASPQRFAALCAAGAMSLEDAAAMVAAQVMLGDVSLPFADGENVEVCAALREERDMLAKAVVAACGSNHWSVARSGQLAKTLAAVRILPVAIPVRIGPPQCLSGTGLEIRWSQPVESSHPLFESTGNPVAAVLRALGMFWTRGCNLCWESLFSAAPQSRIALPTYPFERKRYWIGPVSTAEAAMGQDQAGAAPRPPIRSQIREREPEDLAAAIRVIWSECLSVSNGGDDTTIFDIGGDSLSAINLLESVRRRLHVDIAFADFMPEPTIAGLVRCISARTAADSRGGFESTTEPLSANAVLPSELTTPAL